MSFAIRCLEKPEDAGIIEVDEFRAFDTKIEYLRKLEVSTENLSRPHKSGRKQNDNQPVQKSVLDGIGEEELQR